MKREKPAELFKILPYVQDLLEASHPELAEAISAVREPVCVAHVAAVRRAVPQLSGLDETAVLDDLPVVLDALADIFRHKGGLDALALLGPPHAAVRFGQNLEYQDLLGEYILLGRSLRQQVEQHLERLLDPAERQAFESALQALMTLTVVSFSAQRETRLQLEVTALGHFLSSLAHDLRNELNGTMTAIAAVEEKGAEFFEATPPGAMPEPVQEARERAEELRADVGHCRQMMESTIAAMTRLLEAERLRSEVKLRRRDVALCALIRAVARSAAQAKLGASAAARRRTSERIRIDCPDDLVISTDPDLLSTTLLNLVGNALKHAPSGDVNIRARRRDDGACLITVRDAGPGIPAEEVSKLFQKYMRREHRTDGGFGLGLFIVRRAIGVLGARIEVQSDVGHGTCFVITVPPLSRAGARTEAGDSPAPAGN